MTETTTQPDPQVVACPTCGAAPMMRCISMVNLLPRDDPHTSRIEDAARRPLTLADIPAGQGAASLYIGTGYRGELAVMYRTGLTHDHVFMTEGPDDPSEARRAMWDHLAATLPTVDTKEEGK